MSLEMNSDNLPEELKLRPPNDEQILAIEHNGGVLLSAGAGSGKTFVLVEHILYLFQETYRSHPEISVVEFSTLLKDKFMSTVLMTFTKKAAGELALRLQRRFQVGLERARLGAEEIPLAYWEVASHALHHIFVGTIHSFCYRLILEGFIPGFTGNEAMASDMEVEDKINKLFDMWVEKNEEMLKEDSLEYLMVNKNAFRSQLKGIFSDTDLRLLWTNYHAIEKEDSLISQVEKLLSMSLDFDWRELTVPYYEEAKKKLVWMNFLDETRDAFNYENGYEFLLSVERHCQKYKRVASKPAKGSDEVKTFFDRFSAVRAFIKSYLSDLKACVENEEVYKQGGKLFYDIYSFIEENYLRIEGLTFTDLEYYVWKAVTTNPKTVEQISASYKYFIIDEYQDTSSVQFEIVNSIIQGEVKSIFTVGDVKQAIYGFRGGELEVFRKTEELVGEDNKKSLRNNYRSTAEVIKFNNALFDYLLPLGAKFSGNDPHTVEMVTQEIPETGKPEGAIEKRVVKVKGDLPEGVKSITRPGMNYIESTEIFNYLKEAPLDEEVCILYRNLTPVRFLIEKMINSDLGFTCQVKVSLEEDPIIFLFGEFARTLGLYEEENEVVLSSHIVLSVANLLNVNHLSIEQILEEFDKAHVKYSELGLWESFKSFIWALGLSSSNLDHSLAFVELLAVHGEDNASLTYEKFDGFSSGNEYSIDFQNGKNPSRIKVMTMHASKGLEFGTVILGGIHTNGGERGNESYFGKMPYSYKWFLDAKKSNLFKSPQYIIEDIISKQKSYSESKRLFYVAGTRAVNKIVWIDLEFNDKQLCYSESWIKAIRQWENECRKKDEDVLHVIKDNMKVIERTLDETEIFIKRLDLYPPIFHVNPLGVCEVEEETSGLGISAELSVTRLAEIVKCPRKFFLKNIAKIDSDEFIDFSRIEDDDRLLKDTEENEDENFPVAKKIDYAARGTEVHRVIAHMIDHNFTMPREFDLDDKAIEGVEWVTGILAETRQNSSSDIDYISETGLKFSLLGQMLSGIPDLVITGEDTLEVWDFKTGRITESKLAPYWFQLVCYAYALNNRTIEGYKSIKVILSFVDEKKNLVKEMTLKEIETELFTQWRKLETLNQVNKEHCGFCEYQGLCFPSS